MLEKYHSFELTAVCRLTQRTPAARLVFVSLPRQMIQLLSPYNCHFLLFCFVLFRTFLISFVVLLSHSLCFVFYLRSTRPGKSTANPERTARELEFISVNYWEKN